MFTLKKLHKAQCQNKELLYSIEQLMNSIESIIQSNESLQREIIEKRDYLDSIQKDLINFEKLKMDAIKEKQAATKRLQKYSGSLLKKTRGVALKRIQSEIEKLQINLEDIKSYSSTYKEKLNSEEEIISQITMLNSLKNELVNMNKELKKEAIKYLQEMDFSKYKIPPHIQEQIASLQSKMAKIVLIKSQFNNSVDDDQFFNELNGQLQSALPIFSNLEEIFQDYALSAFPSTLTFGSSVLSAISLSSFCERNSIEFSEKYSLNSSNLSSTPNGIFADSTGKLSDFPTEKTRSLTDRSESIQKVKESDNQNKQEKEKDLNILQTRKNTFSKGKKDFLDLSNNNNNETENQKSITKETNSKLEQNEKRKNNENITYKEKESRQYNYNNISSKNKNNEKLHQVNNGENGKDESENEYQTNNNENRSMKYEIRENSPNKATRNNKETNKSESEQFNQKNETKYKNDEYQSHRNNSNASESEEYQKSSEEPSRRSGYSTKSKGGKYRNNRQKAEKNEKTLSKKKSKPKCKSDYSNESENEEKLEGSEEVLNNKSHVRSRSIDENESERSELILSNCTKPQRKQNKSKGINLEESEPESEEQQIGDEKAKRRSEVISSCSKKRQRKQSKFKNISLEENESESEEYQSDDEKSMHNEHTNKSERRKHHKTKNEAKIVSKEEDEWESEEYQSDDKSERRKHHKTKNKAKNVSKEEDESESEEQQKQKRRSEVVSSKGKKHKRRENEEESDSENDEQQKTKNKSKSIKEYESDIEERQINSRKPKRRSEATLYNSRKRHRKESEEESESESEEYQSYGEKSIHNEYTDKSEKRKHRKTKNKVKIVSKEEESDIEERQSNSRKPKRRSEAIIYNNRKPHRNENEEESESESEEQQIMKNKSKSIKEEESESEELKSNSRKPKRISEAILYNNRKPHRNENEEYQSYGEKSISSERADNSERKKRKENEKRKSKSKKLYSKNSDSVTIGTSNSSKTISFKLDVSDQGDNNAELDKLVNIIRKHSKEEFFSKTTVSARKPLKLTIDDKTDSDTFIRPILTHAKSSVDFKPKIANIIKPTTSSILPSLNDKKTNNDQQDLSTEPITSFYKTEFTKNLYINVETLGKKQQKDLNVNSLKQFKESEIEQMIKEAKKKLKKINNEIQFLGNRIKMTRKNQKQQNFISFDFVESFYVSLSTTKQKSFNKRTIPIQTKLTNANVNEITNKIKNNSKNNSLYYKKKKEKNLIELKLNQIRDSLNIYQETNKNLKNAIERLEKITLINGSTKIERQRKRFEIALRESAETNLNLDAKISEKLNEIEKLKNDINEQREIHKILKIKIEKGRNGNNTNLQEIKLLLRKNIQEENEMIENKKKLAFEEMVLSDRIGYLKEIISKKEKLKNKISVLKKRIISLKNSVETDSEHITSQKEFDNIQNMISQYTRDSDQLKQDKMVTMVKIQKEIKKLKKIGIDIT